MAMKILGRMTVNRLAPVDVLQKVWLTSNKVIICKFPVFRINFLESISIQLSDEAGEVIVLEESGQQISGEFGRVPDNKTLVVLTPGDNRISGGIIHHFISLGNKRRQSIDATRIFIHHNSSYTPDLQSNKFPQKSQDVCELKTHHLQSIQSLSAKTSQIHIKTGKPSNKSLPLSARTRQ
nr:hypothetical protein Iba_scaffold47220CG0010 [Ipomoea batatas]GME00880.1 hypothetical protein Iba_scaffold56159CG0010 [Ipomoea batatas]